MAPRRVGERKPKVIPLDEQVVVDDFDQCAQVVLAFPDGISATAFLPGVPRAGEVLTAHRWGRRWRTEGRFRVHEVEWFYEGRVPGRVKVHLEPETTWRARRAQASSPE
jgi:hypothetical protein